MEATGPAKTPQEIARTMTTTKKTSRTFPAPEKPRAGGM